MYWCSVYYHGYSQPLPDLGGGEGSEAGRGRQIAGRERRRREVIEVLHCSGVPGVNRVVLETSNNHVTQRLKEHLEKRRQFGGRVFSRISSKLEFRRGKAHRKVVCGFTVHLYQFQFLKHLQSSRNTKFSTDKVYDGVYNIRTYSELMVMS